MKDEASVPEVKRESKKGGPFLEWVMVLIVALLIAFGIRQFVFEQFTVDGHSMDTTLANGERLIIDKVPYIFGIPKRGDIIVFHAPDGDDWVKRVIGLPGDTVQVLNGKLLLDGRVINEPYINGPMDPTRPYGPEKVPPGDLFVMGDNRNISEDSRIIGPIPISSVVGRVDLLFWPFDKFAVIGTSGEKYLPQNP